MALVSILSPTLIGNWFQKRKGMVMGIAASMASIFAVVMNPVINRLIETIGWRAAYMVTGLFPLALVFHRSV